MDKSPVTEAFERTGTTIRLDDEHIRRIQRQELVQIVAIVALVAIAAAVMACAAAMTYLTAG